MRVGPEARYANLDLRELGLEFDSVALGDDGSLAIGSVPAGPTEIGTPLGLLAAFSGPAGIGVDREGNVYVSDTAGHRILRIDCLGRAAPLRCLRGPGSRPGEVTRPRGLAVGPRDALYVADSGNHRIQVVDLRTEQVRAVFGQADPYAEPRHGTYAGAFNEPWDVAADSAGGLYVSEAGNRRVQKLDAEGAPDRDFVRRMGAVERPKAPAHVAVGELDGKERLLVLDDLGAGRSRLLVYDHDGSYDAERTKSWSRALAEAAPELLRQPAAGLAVRAGVLVIGDASGGRVFTFDQRGRFRGVSRGARASMAALAFDCDGRVVLHPGGSGGSALRFTQDLSAASGSVRIGPISVSRRDPRTTRWGQVTVRTEGLGDGAHLRLFTCTTDAAGAVPPMLPTSLPDPTGDEPTPLGEWRAAPADALDFLVLNEPGRFLWIAGRLQGGRLGAPVIHGFRVTWDDESLLSHLPAVYSDEPASRRFLQRALALFERAFDELEERAGALPRLFDPGSAPDARDEPWLDWLAGWLAFDLDARWDGAKRRDVVRRAFELNGRRGTAASLRELAQLSLGTHVVVTEPARFAHLWTLGAADSALGFGTGLAPAEPQGAVVGTTATVEHSHLIEDEDHGAPLFLDLAHHFCVHAHAAELAEPGEREQLESLIERERPAHTTSHLCLVEPRARVGFQARLGVDAVVAAHDLPLRIGLRGEIGTTAALADDRSPAGAVVGTTTVRGTKSI